MNYYLAFIRSYCKDDGYYELVKAETKNEAISKVINKVGSKKLIVVSETIE